MEKEGLQDYFMIESAATSREELGNPVHSGARRKLLEHGIHCDGKFARQMTYTDYENFDYLNPISHFFKIKFKYHQAFLVFGWNQPRTDYTYFLKSRQHRL